MCFKESIVTNTVSCELWDGISTTTSSSTGVTVVLGAGGNLNILIFVVGWQAKCLAEPVAYMVSLKRLKGLWDITLWKYITEFPNKFMIKRRLPKSKKSGSYAPIGENLRVSQKGGSA